jgi:hypothetical protein
MPDYSKMTTEQLRKALLENHEAARWNRITYREAREVAQAINNVVIKRLLEKLK